MFCFVRFKQAWAEVDPKGTGYIPKNQIAALFSVSSAYIHQKIRIAETDPNT
jgi:hypothetical protein